MQVEYATDIIFKDQKTLAPIYEELVRTLSHAVKPNNIAMFLGKRLDPRFEGELGNINTATLLRNAWSWFANSSARYHILVVDNLH